MTASRILQAGMGIGISNWVLASAVASRGEVGVVSGTGIETVLIRRLQDGDIGGHMRFAMAHFPDQEFAADIEREFYVSGGKPPTKAYKVVPMMTYPLSQKRQRLLILANFVEVFMAKRGHSGKVGINFLEKIQLPILPSLYGGHTCGRRLRSHWSRNPS